MNIPFITNQPSRIFIILIICLLGFIVYSHTFYYPFHFDDEPSIPANFSIRDISNLKAIWNFCPTRFITYLSFSLNYHFHKLNVFGYHLVNLLIHLISASLVYWFVSLSFSTPILKKERISQYSRFIAFFCGLIFVSHPLQTQAVTYIVQRTTSLAALFYIAALSLYVKAMLVKPKTLTGKAYYAFSLLIAILGMFTKEIVFTLPFMILLYEFCFFRADKRLNWRYILPFFIVLIIMLLWIYFGRLIDFQEIERVAKPPSVISYLLTQFRVLATYLRLLFLPIRQNLLYDYPLSQSLWELPTLAGLGLLISIFVAGIKLFPKHRLASFAIFWFFLSLSIESSLIPIRDVIFEHRLYLPMLGFSLFLASGLFTILENKSRKILILALSLSIITTYSVLTYKRNLVWRDELTLWNDVVGKFSPATEALMNSLDNHSDTSEYGKSVFNEHIMETLKINQNFLAAYLNRGRAYVDKGEYDKALFDLSKVLKIDPTYENAYYHLGRAYVEKGEYDRAISEFNKLQSIHPHYANVYSLRGNAYRAKKEYAKAVSDYNQALKIRADFIEVYLDRGITYRLQGEIDKAISDYNYILQLDPAYVMAYNNRGYAYFLKKEYGQAILDYNQAIKINPEYAQAYYNRARTYLTKGEYEKARDDVRKIQSLGYEVSAEFLEQLGKCSELAQ